MQQHRIRGFLEIINSLVQSVLDKINEATILFLQMV